MRRSTLIALLLVLFSVPLLSQVSTQDRDARMQAALRLARLLNPPDTYRDRMRTLYAGMTPMFAQAAENGTLPPDFAERMSKVMEEVMPYEAFTRLFAEQYAEHFSADELGDITRFYSSPTGAKLLAASTDIGVGFMQKMTADIMPKLQDAMRKQGLIK